MDEPFSVSSVLSCVPFVSAPWSGASGGNR
jgi:hypothetical protein